MEEARIIDRGRGPEIEGTRITVYDIFEYGCAGWECDAIAATLRLSSRQVRAALDYIREHEFEVRAVYERAMERARRGNPVWVEQRLQQNRAKLKALQARAGASYPGVAQHAGHRGRHKCCWATQRSGGDGSGRADLIPRDRGAFIRRTAITTSSSLPTSPTSVPLFWVSPAALHSPAA